jgi:hypothetical protein
MNAVKSLLAAILVIAGYAMSDARMLLGAAAHGQPCEVGRIGPSGGGATCET